MIDSLPAYTCEMKGNYGSLRILYALAVIDAGESFYQITCWSEAGSAGNPDLFSAVIQSFRLRENP